MKKIRKTKNTIILTAIGLTALFSINTSLAATKGKVSTSAVNIREEANSTSSVVASATKDQEVEILEKNGDWYKVNVDGVTGYIRQDLVTVEEESDNSNTSNTQATNTTDGAQTATNTTTATNTAAATNTTNEQTSEEQPSGNGETNSNSNNETASNVNDKQIAQDTKLKAVPVINSGNITELKKGEKVTVGEEINGWVCIETQNEKGWVREEMVISSDIKIEDEEPGTENPEEPETDEETTPEESPTADATSNTDTLIKTMYVNTDLVNVREEASTSSEVVMKLTINTEVAIYQELDDWYKIKVEGREGYISKALLSDSKKETVTSRSLMTPREQSETTGNSGTASGTAIVETANKYMGYRYVSGGAGPNTFDCSGFTQYIYKLNGINLNRTAAAQYSNGVAVSKSELQLGDLVMFGPSASGINHVGIYIGGGRMIHAANPSRGVVTDTINSGYYYTNYVGARRITQ